MSTAATDTAAATPLIPDPRSLTADLTARLDAVPLSGFRYFLLALSGLGWMFDAMDILIVGSVIAAAYLLERWGRKGTLVSFLALCAVGAYLFGQVAQQPRLGPADVPAILLWGSVISFFNLGAWGVVYTYTPELYPTRLRGTGAGFAAGFGRLWGILAPLSIGWQLALFGNDTTVFLVFMGVMLLGALIVLLLGEETRGRSLEEIAGG